MTTRLADATEEDSLERQLWNVANATEDGQVRGQITECAETDAGDIAVSVRLPNNEIHTETFAFPQADTREYEFVRLIEDCGFSLGSVEHFVGTEADGAEVWCEPVEDHDADSDGDDWRITVPEYTPPLRERCRGRLAVFDSKQVMTPLAVAGGIVVLPLLLPIMLFWLASDDEFEDMAILLVFSPVLVMCWVFVLLILYGTFLPVFEFVLGVDLPGVKPLI